MIINALRLFKMNDIREIEKMTYHEYDLRLTAYKLQEVDRMKNIHELAWASREVKAANKKGEYVYDKFNKFFDVEKVENDILGIEKESKFSTEDKEFIKLLLN